MSPPVRSSVKVLVSCPRKISESSEVREVAPNRKRPPVNISIQVNDPTYLDASSHSTFEVGFDYNIERLHKWVASIVKATPHIAFRYEGVVGTGDSIEAAVNDLAIQLKVRMRVAIETRPSREEIEKTVFAHYDTLKATGYERIYMTELEDALRLYLFEKGWTFRGWWYKTNAGPLHDGPFARYRQFKAERAAIEADRAQAGGSV